MPRLRAVGPLTLLVACLAACASEPEPAKPPTVAAPVPRPVMPVPEVSSDRGERTLPVSPIGRIAPEIAPSVVGRP